MRQQTLNNLEREILKKLVDEKYGQVSNSTDYEPTSGIYDKGIEGSIYKKTGEKISGSTLERMVGLRGNENRKTNIRTIDIVANYLDFSSGSELLKFISVRAKHKREFTEKFELFSFIKNHFLKVFVGSDKILTLKFLAENKFEVILSVNTILQKKDEILITQLEDHKELIIEKVFRKSNENMINLGGYASGYNNIVLGISIIGKV